VLWKLSPNYEGRTEMKKQKPKVRKSNVMDPQHLVDDELIAMKRNKVEIWKQAEDRAKTYLMSARKKRLEAEKELRKLVNVR
jgi:hypothetical protein